MPPQRTRSSGVESGLTVTAAFEDGPLRGSTIELEFVEGRPPKTVDVSAPGVGLCRYCLATWVQGGPRARYTFLYLVVGASPRSLPAPAAGLVDQLEAQ